MHLSWPDLQLPCMFGCRNSSAHVFGRVPDLH
jgi:hypothetical protein